MSLKVWQIDPAHLTPYYDHALCSALAQAGCNIRFFSTPFLYDPALPSSLSYTTDYAYFRGATHYRFLEFPRLRRTMRIALYLFGHRRVLRQLMDEPPDVVHLQWSRVPPAERWLITQIRQRGIPVVHTVHDIEPLFPVSNLNDIYSSVDRLIVHALANRDALLQRYPSIKPERVQVIPHIAPDVYSPPEADRTLARQRFEIDPDALVVLFFGSIRHYKGLDVLIDAFSRARQSCPALHLLIAGRPDKAAQLAPVNQLGNSATVYAHFIPSDRVWIYHLAADIAVFPYRQITQSGALITAMTFGLPVIATNLGGFPETVDSNGWIIPPEDPIALAKVLVEAIQYRNNLKSLGLRSLELIRQRHSPALVAEQTMAVYREVLGAASPLPH